MKSKAYRATVVNRVDGGRISQEHPGQPLTIGLDIGKDRVLAVARWPAGQGRKGSGANQKGKGDCVN
jgi:hypothetical protein